MGVMPSATDSLDWLSRIGGRHPSDLTPALGDSLLAPDGARLFPYLSGERTPHNDTAIRGAFTGLDLTEHVDKAIKGSARPIPDCGKSSKPCRSYDPRRTPMIYCCGEALIDMIPETTMSGGAVFNTAIALGRLGAAAGMVTGLSTDVFGRQLTEALTASRVQTARVIRADRPTTLAFVTLNNGQASYAFFDENSAGQMLQPADMPPLPADGGALFLGGISLTVEPCADAYACAAFADRECEQDCQPVEGLATEGVDLVDRQRALDREPQREGAGQQRREAQRRVRQRDAEGVGHIVGKGRHSSSVHPGHSQHHRAGSCGSSGAGPRSKYR